MIYHFSKLVMTSEIHFPAAAEEIECCGTLVIFESGSAGAVWSTRTVAPQFLFRITVNI